VKFFEVPSQLQAFGGKVVLRSAKYLRVTIAHPDFGFPLFINSDQKYAPPSLLRWNDRLVELAPQMS